MDGFDINSLEIGYWEKKAVDRLRQAYDRVKEAREMLIHQNKQKPLETDLEERFQLAAKLIMETAKALRPEPETPTTEGVLLNEKK